MQLSGAILKSVFDSTDDVWFFVTADYAITFFNKKAAENCRLLHGKELTAGDNILDYAKDTNNNTDQNFIDCFARALQGELVKCEWEVVYANAAYWFLSKYVPVYYNKRLIGISIEVSDITLEKKQQEAQQKSKEEIQLLLEKKDEFISIASHELKTPITSIKAYNQILQQLAHNELILDYLSREQQQIRKLERLIADLLDVTKMSSGRLYYRKDYFMLNTVISNSLETIKHTTKQHEIVLVNNPDVLLFGDKVRIEQVIYNLLSNAVKYSPEADKIIVDVIVASGNVIISITDFGIGIASDHITKIFERFYRIEQTSGNFSGLGLGLFISNQIIEEHKGTIWIESKENKGSTFYVSLPYHNDINGN